MDILRDVITADELRQEQDAVFDDLLATANPKIIIYEGTPAIVLVTAALYQEQLTRLAILEKMMAGRKDIEAGRVVPNTQVIDKLKGLIAETTKAVAHGQG